MRKIMVVGHQRSGNHFLLNSLSMNFGYKPIENSILGNNKELYKKIIDTPDNVLIKSHHHSDFFNKKIDNVFFIYIVRDFRDVITSCFYYFNSASKYLNRQKKPSIHPVCKSVKELIYINPTKYSFHATYNRTKPITMLDHWLEHIKSWKDAYTIRYENLINNFEDEITKIGKILNVKPMLKKPTIKNRGIANRKGIIGDWKNHLNKKESDKIIKHIGGNYGHYFIM